MTIPPATIDKLGKLFPRLASDHDGEVVATARAIIRTLTAAGSSLHEVAAEMQPKVRIEERVVYRDAPKTKAKRKKAPEPPPPRPDRGRFIPYDQVMRWAPYLLKEGGLNERTASFVKTMFNLATAFGERFEVSKKQAEWWQMIMAEHDLDTPSAAAASTEGVSA
ncbi:hypothetical protein ACLE20_15090 [Rhizobium sp. YIM 134829]|uniref:hypothetical protein n=1 Tax=Rhizobium sp. YIM 134829 TaxID=3390453 RepID=UPI00397DD16C